MALKPVKRLEKVHEGNVHVCEYHPFGHYLITGGQDGSMQFWVKTEGDGDWYKATPDGDRLKVDYQTTR